MHACIIDVEVHRDQFIQVAQPRQKQGLRWPASIGGPERKDALFNQDMVEQVLALVCAMHGRT
eukprot:scaffold128154_cov14-Tisochrysis_lutea.AAC.1